MSEHSEPKSFVEDLEQKIFELQENLTNLATQADRLSGEMLTEIKRLRDKLEELKHALILAVLYVPSYGEERGRTGDGKDVRTICDEALK